MKVAILQRVCTPYRVPLFRALSEEEDIEFKLFIGDNVPESKVKNAQNLSEINHIKLKSRFIKLRGHYFPIHTDLIKNLLKFKPDVIICEGESHFFGYLQAIFYKIFLRREVKLIHWCFIALPGEDLSKKRLISSVKSFFRKFFDGFLVYSSYSKKRLLEIGGVPENRIFVATNVGNVERMVSAFNMMSTTKKDARISLNLKDRFTVLYLGTLDHNKRPELLIELSSINKFSNFNFVLAGDGPLYNHLRDLIHDRELENVFMVGKITSELYTLLMSSDVLIIPGRGGIVISEAMAFGIPVIVYQADGTEYDLVETGETGILLDEGKIDDFSNAIYQIVSLSPEQRVRMSVSCHDKVSQTFNTKNMVNQIKEAILVV